MLLLFDTYCSEPELPPRTPGSKWISHFYMTEFRSYFADLIYSLFACTMAYCSHTYYNNVLFRQIQKHELLSIGVKIYHQFCFALRAGSQNSKFEIPPSLIEKIIAFQVKTQELNIRQKAAEITEYYDQIYKEGLCPMQISPLTAAPLELVTVEDISDSEQ